MKFELLGRTVRFQGNPHMLDAEISRSGLRKSVARWEVAYFCQLVCDPPTPREPINNRRDRGSPNWIQRYPDRTDGNAVVERNGSPDQYDVGSQANQHSSVSIHAFPEEQDRTSDVRDVATRSHPTECEVILLSGVTGPQEGRNLTVLCGLPCLEHGDNSRLISNPLHGRASWCQAIYLS